MSTIRLRARSTTFEIEDFQKCVWICMMYDDVFAKRVTGESAAGADLEL